MRRAWMLPVLGLMAGCTGEAPESGFVVRDSAGIAIVESRVPQWESGGAWEVESEPALRIGRAEGEENDLLFGVVDGAVLSDGRIAVLNRGTHQLRLYSEAGEYISAIGGEGNGPGEFRSPLRMFRLPGDSLVVLGFDRVSTFGSNGEFVRSRGYGPPQALARFSDGSLLGLVWASGQDPYELGLVRPRLSLVSLAADGSSRDTLAEVFGDEEYRAEMAGGLGSSRRPLGRIRSVVAEGEEVYTGDGSTFEIRVIGEDGSVRRIIRRAAESTLRRADQARFEEAYLAEDLPEALLQRRRQLLRELPYPDQLPAFDKLLADGAGNLWARHYVIADEAHRWSVFDPAGHWLGIVTMPDGLDVLEIGDDYVLGRTADALGVERVQLHVLRKPARSAG